MQWYKKKAINCSNHGVFWQKSTVRNQIIFPKLFDLLFVMYQSIPSLTIPPGNFFDGRIPHPPAKKELKTPTPRAYKNELKPQPRGHFPQLFTIKIN